MLGSVPHTRWLEILAASDIFLMPSKYEGISIALLEAMAAGVVPVVAKVGGQEEIVDPGAGVLIARTLFSKLSRNLSRPRKTSRSGDSALSRFAIGKPAWRAIRGLGLR